MSPNGSKRGRDTGSPTGFGVRVTLSAKVNFPCGAGLGSDVIFGNDVEMLTGNACQLEHAIDRAKQYAQQKTCKRTS